MWYYHSRRDDTEVVDALSKLAEELPTRGFEVYYKRLRREGRNWNRKRVLRVYRSMNLKLRRRHKKRLPARTKNPLEAPMELNEVWSMDFMADVLSDGRKIRVFNVMDDCNREALAMDVGLNYPAIRVVETLSQLEEEIGLPKTIRCDNGPEFISKTLSQWCKGKRVELQFIQPGKPMQNGYMERLNRFYGGGCARCLLVQRPAPSKDTDPKMDGGLQYQASPFIHRGYAAQGIQKPFRGRILPRNRQH